MDGGCTRYLPIYNAFNIYLFKSVVYCQIEGWMDGRGMDGSALIRQSIHPSVYQYTMFLIYIFIQMDGWMGVGWSGAPPIHPCFYQYTMLLIYI